MTVQKYRKKPVVIEALEFTPLNGEAVYTFMGMEDVLKTIPLEDLVYEGELHIPTLEDGSKGQVEHMATVGDFIIKGVEGEFYPCKPDIFHKTYDKEM